MYKTGKGLSGDEGGQVDVDLRSDTVTQPSREMKEAMMSAPLGDDVFRDDPTVILLEKKMAELAGKEAALFVPSGSMGNLICVMSHCWERGAEILIGDKCHISVYEQGGVSGLASIHPRTLTNSKDGTFSLEQLELMVRDDDVHYPVTTLVTIENSHNKCGGRTLPREWVAQLVATCRRLKLPIHCDGARIFNTSVSQGIPLKDLLEGIDSASICLSKGLGCPIGSVIVGSHQLMARAERVRKCLGGGMRQVGVLAAAGLYALDNMVERLAEDHTHARMLAEAVNLAGKGRFTVDMETVETNIVVMWVDPKIASPLEVVKNLEEGRVRVRCLDLSHDKIRFVFHCMIGRESAVLAIEKLTQTIEEFLQ